MNYKKLAIIATLMVLVLAGWWIFLAISRRGLSKVDIVAVPSDSSVTLDGKKINTGTIYLKPGYYTVKATRQYFGDYVTTLDARKSLSSPFYVTPVANTSEATKWLADHPKESQLLNKIGAAKTAKTQDELSKYRTVLSSLPVETSDYRIDYSVDSNNNVSFQVTLYPIINDPSQYDAYVAQDKQFKQEAQQFLESKGVDISKANITYTPDL